MINIMSLIKDKMYEKNGRKKNPNDWPRCYLCNSPTNPNTSIYIEVFEGGAKAVFIDNYSSSIDDNDPGYMGCFPVGPKCSKLLKNKLGGKK